MKNTFLFMLNDMIGSVELAGNAVQDAELVALTASQGLFTANNLWMMIATAFVFIMHLGFAGVEAGFAQAKNTVNILFKNTLTPIIRVKPWRNRVPVHFKENIGYPRVCRT